MSAAKRGSAGRLASALFLVLVLAAALWIAITRGTSPKGSEVPRLVPRPSPAARDSASSSGPTLRATPAVDPTPGSGPPGNVSPPLASGVFRGRVIDEGTGSAVGTARVGVCCAGEAGVARDRLVDVGPDGSFEITAPAECAVGTGVCLLARAPGYAQAQLQDPHPGDGLVIQLARGVTISGTVETPWGSPISGALVRARVPWNVSGWPASDFEVAGNGSTGGQALTNDVGAFRIEGLSEKQEYDLLPSKDGFAFHGSDYERVRAPISGVKTRLWPEARLRLVDPRNTAAAEAGVPETVWLPSIMFQKNPGLRHIGSPFWRNGHVLEERFLVDSAIDLEADIPISFGVLTPGKGWVQMTGAVRAGRTVSITLPDAAAGTTRAPVTLTASFAGGQLYSGTISLSVSSGAAPEPAFVRMPFADGRAKGPLLLEPGEYLMSGAAGGDVGSAFWTPFSDVRVRVPQEGTALALSLIGSVYTLDVRDEAGQAVRDYLVQVERDGRPASGWYQYPGREGDLAAVSPARMWLGEGAHTVRVGTPLRGYSEVRVQALGDGRTTQLTITLRAGKGVDLWASSRRMRGGR